MGEAWPRVVLLWLLVQFRWLRAVRRTDLQWHQHRSSRCRVLQVCTTNSRQRKREREGREAGRDIDKVWHCRVEWSFWDVPGTRTRQQLSGSWFEGSECKSLWGALCQSLRVQLSWWKIDKRKRNRREKGPHFLLSVLSAFTGTHRVSTALVKMGA